MERRAHYRYVAALALALLVLSGCMARKSTVRVALARTYDPGSGIYADLGNYIFSQRVVRMGMFKPDQFTEAIGFGIFLDEPHHPDRIPVLLVHGHGSGPRSFREVAARMDRQRFEPWFGYYATGQSIPKTATLLRRSLVEVAEHHGVDRVVMVGYSQGGLVVRAALKPADDELVLPDVPLLIGLSTPWGGSEAAAFGLQRTSGAPPAWKDMATGSPFIASLFDEPLPDGTELHIVYGTGGDNERFPGKNDGTIGEPSLAHPEALAEATSVSVFPEAIHSSMVLDPEPLAVLDDLLAGLGTDA
jgi:pimeloyl-ACP methyl ester carboxylesterase